MSSTGISENPALKQLIYPRLYLRPCLRWVVVKAATSADAEDYSIQIKLQLTGKYGLIS